MKKITIFVFIAFLSIKSYGQVYYSENFNAGLNGWAASDLDGDGQNWANGNASGVNAAFETGSLISRSWTATTGPLRPNNLITSTAYNLGTVTASNLFLEFNIATEVAYPAEKYSVYVTTVNSSSAVIATTPVFTETVAVGGLSLRQINLTSFIGQTVYISFRHYDCYDKNYLVVDNVILKSLPANDTQLVTATLPRYALANTSNTLALNVKNQGATTISSLTVNWNDGVDHSSIISTSIAPGATATISHPTAVQYSSVIEKNIAVAITAVNGVADATPADNAATKKFNTVSQNSTKKVLFEEGTGTWCGWCPRGAVAMDYMYANYANEFIGVAVHNGSSNPMTLAAYNTGAGISGFPGMNVDRVVKGAGVSQANMIANLNTRKVLPVPVSLSATGSVSGNSIVINAMATFRSVFANANYRLGVIISEDNVTGTTSGYAQVNYYAGGGAGPMGGYELLPDPVPAAQMVYKHVGRALLGGYAGQTGSIPTTITDGQQASYTFNYTVPATSNVNNMHAVLVLIDQDNGEIVNANSVVLSTLSTNTSEFTNTEIAVYPNPSSDVFNIKGLKSGNYNVEIFDINGKLVKKSYNNNILNEENIIIDVNGVSTGNYILNISTKGASYSKNVIIQ